MISNSPSSFSAAFEVLTLFTYLCRGLVLLAALLFTACLLSAETIGLPVRVNGVRYCVEIGEDGVGPTWFSATCRTWAAEGEDARLNEFARRIALASAALRQEGKPLTSAQIRAILGTGGK